MTKKAKDKNEWTSSSLGAYMTEQFRVRAVKGDILDAGEAAACDIGFRLPHLCLRYLFQRTTFPLQRTMLLFGLAGSNKSALTYWFYDLFRRHTGKYLHIDTEDKDTPVLRLSLTGHDRDAGWRRTVKTMDEFQTTVSTFIDWFKGRCGTKDGPGKRIPFVVGIDSLTAKLTKGAQDKMESEDGAAGRRFADEARSLSDWFKYVPNLLTGWPIGLIAVNHDKPVPSTAIPNQLEHRSPGGSAPLFYATYRILVTKVRKIKQHASGWEGNIVKLEMNKSSLGADKMRVEVEFTWRVDAVESVSGKGTTMRQESVWNWDKATTELLYTMADKDKGTARGNAVADLLGLVKQTGGKYSSKALGISPDEALGAAPMGQLIENSPEVLAKLEPVLGIHGSVEYRDGVDFDEQLVDARASVDDFMPKPVAYRDEAEVVDGDGEGEAADE